MMTTPTMKGLRTRKGMRGRQSFRACARHSSIKGRKLMTWDGDCGEVGRGGVGEGEDGRRRWEEGRWKRREPRRRGR